MKRLLLLMISLVLLTGCVREESNDNSPMGNFEALWRIIDEHYCFLDYKQVDWNAVKAHYQPYITDDLSNDKLFQILGNMLAELKDGHVNLYAYHNTARYWNWYEDYPRNYNEELVEKYLGHEYRIGGGLRYRILDDNIGYIYCPSFNSGLGEGNISQVLQDFAECTGIIIDVRGNSGGELVKAERLASHFTNERILVGYMSHKTGTGHNDFSGLQEIWLEPSDGIRWQKKAVVLTNRRCYSATNDFVKDMKECPKVTVIGDQTGGGSGMPFSSELPNGWSVRFSACPIYDVGKNHTEFGILPDINVSMKIEDILKNKDTLIEFARDFLKN